jgi:hypothetical protein
MRQESRPGCNISLLPLSGDMLSGIVRLQLNRIGKRIAGEEMTEAKVEVKDGEFAYSVS